MKLSQFKFDLPAELIADKPTKNREESKLMVVDRKSATISHYVFKDILDFFGEGDTMVINNTKVFPARLYGEKEKTGAKIEVFLLRELNRETRLWDVLVDPARKIRIGNKLYFGEDETLVAEVIDNTTSRGRTLRFLFDGPYEEFKKTIQQLGETPLPKIHNRPATEVDKERYQTIYAKHEGAVAAPTAGLHFTEPLLNQLQQQGVHLAWVTLHVGTGTFKPVTAENLEDHEIHSEWYEVDAENARAINAAKGAGGRIVAVGTTATRVLETVASGPRVAPGTGTTGLFITPGYEFKIVDAMITNFHLPRSTLLALVAAFAGLDATLAAYRHAVEQRYRFYSYGDAMLIL